MVKAIWNGVEVAHSDNTTVVEGNHYFPSSDVEMQYLTETDHTTECPWKGEASYFDIAVNGETNPNAAWYYPNPLPAAEKIANHIAFWKGVEVIDDSEQS